MRTLKLMIVGILISLSTISYSAEAPLSGKTFTETDVVGKDELSLEISRMLRESELIIEKETAVIVIINVTSEKKILIRSILSRDPEVISFLETRLQNRKLHGRSWKKGKLYVVPVKLEVTR